MVKNIDGGIFAAAGYKAASMRVGIKPTGENRDLSLMVSETPATVAGTFTKNIVKAAPVKWDMEVVNRGVARAIVVNTGIANAATPLGITAVKGMYKRGGRYAKRNIAMLTVLNTASIQLIPTTIGTLRAAHGSTAPFEITAPILIVSLISASAGCIAVNALSLRRKKNAA